MFQDPQHFGNGDIRTRRKHVAELADNDVERFRFERQLLYVSLVPIDVDASERRIGTGRF